MTNSVDPDLKKPTDLHLHCLQKQVYPGSAGQGLKNLEQADENIEAKSTRTCHRSVNVLVVNNLLTVVIP